MTHHKTGPIKERNFSVLKVSGFQFNTCTNLQSQSRLLKKQECIPVGCVPPTSVTVSTGGGVFLCVLVVRCQRGCLPLGPGGIYLWVKGVSTTPPFTTPHLPHPFHHIPSVDRMTDTRLFTVGNQMRCSTLPSSISIHLDLLKMDFKVVLELYHMFQHENCVFFKCTKLTTRKNFEKLDNF